jgi:hypothetical protein
MQARCLECIALQPTRRPASAGASSEPGFLSLLMQVLLRD